MSTATIKRKTNGSFHNVITDNEKTEEYNGRNVSVVPDGSRYEIAFTITKVIGSTTRIINKSFIVDSYSYL